MIVSLNIMLRVVLIPRGVINHGEDKPSCIQSERYPIRSRLAESKGLHKLRSVFEGIQEPLYYLWHVRVLSIKPCLHTKLPEHNKSYRKVSQGWGHLITRNGPIMGHLNSFSASGGGNLNKNFPKIQMPGGGMLKLRFDWYIIGFVTLGSKVTFSGRSAAFSSLSQSSRF